MAAALSGDPNKTIIIVCGAGASFDCVAAPTLAEVELPGARRAYTWASARPPLTAALTQVSPVTQDLLDGYPDALPVVAFVDRTIRRQGVALEDALAQYAESPDPRASHQLAAFRLLLRDHLHLATEFALSADISGGRTNYVELVSVARQWAVENHGHVCFVTFNYDTLLDEACANFGSLTLNDPDSYTNDDYLTLVRPHGCAAWAWPEAQDAIYSTREGADRVVIDNGENEGITFDPDRLVVDRIPGTPPQSGPFHPMRPALALPMKAVSKFAWPPSHEMHFGRVMASGTSRLLTIGWRGQEGHFQSLLRQAFRGQMRALLVTGSADDTREVFRAIWPQGGTVDCERVNDGFTSLLNEHQEDLDWLFR